MSRDNQFAGFAKMLWQELYHEIDWQQDSGENAEQIIAQRAYDLVMHAVSETTGAKSIDHVPDMRQWPEETGK